MTCVRTHASNCTYPRHLIIGLENRIGTCFSHVTLASGQPAGLSKEVCLYEGADWLWLIRKSEGGERSTYSLPGSFTFLFTTGLLVHGH